MEITTTDGRKLWMLRLGHPDYPHGSDYVLCEDASGHRVILNLVDIQEVRGIYSFAPRRTR